MSECWKGRAELEKGEDHYCYDLKSIIIHSGGPYGGHYWCYTKDDLKEGEWNLQLPEEWANAPTEILTKDQ